MKKFFSLCAITCAILAFQSCATVNHPLYCNSEGKLGSKVGEATSTEYLFLWTSKGQDQTIQEAAKSAGITKITHVEYQNQAVLLGLVMKHTTRVYGE